MKDSYTKRMLLTKSDPGSPNQIPERVALINEDGSPVYLPSESELNSRYAPHRGRGIRVGATGDSITDGQSNFTVSEAKYGTDSWFNTACVRSGGRVFPLFNVGVSGETSTQILARLPATLDANAGVEAVFVLAGANDPDSGITSAQTIANLLAMYNACLSRGITPIPCTCNPRNARGAGAFSAINTWIRNWAVRNDLPFCDFEAVTGNASTGLWITTLSTDGVHPYAGGQAGVAVMADEALRTINVLFPRATSSVPLSALDNPASGTEYDSNNLFLGGLFTVDTNADGVGDNWTAAGTGTNTYSRVAMANGRGFWQQWDRTASNANFNTLSNVTPNAARIGTIVGDRMGFGYRIEQEVTTMADPCVSLVNLLCRNAGGGTVYTVQPTDLLAQPVTNGAAWVEFIVPDLVTNFRLDVRFQGGTGRLRIGQITLVNLTDIGVA